MQDPNDIAPADAREAGVLHKWWTGEVYGKDSIAVFLVRYRHTDVDTWEQHYFSPEFEWVAYKPVGLIQPCFEITGFAAQEDNEMKRQARVVAELIHNALEDLP